MTGAAAVVAELKRTGQLWEPGCGLVGFRGALRRLHEQVAGALRQVCLEEADDEWLTPPVLSFDTLERADYFASFPQWLTATAHLEGTDDIAHAACPRAAAQERLRPSAWALQPAVCYHVYAALSGQTVDEPATCTVAGTCWRHEAGRFAALERGWPFTMREGVCVGTAEDVQAFLACGRERALDFARSVGLSPRIEVATDPFFAPAARGRALLQQLRALKHELLLPIGDGRDVAAASFNDHGAFFGDVFDIRDATGRAAGSGCVAFGIERWVLAILTEHGADARNWPSAELASLARWGDT